MGIEMTVVKVSALTDSAANALIGQGFPEENARIVAEEFVVAEIAGVKTHGLGKLVSLNLGDLTATPEFKRNGAVLSVDGRGANGFVLFQRLVSEAIDIAGENGVALVFAHNFSRYSSLYPYTNALATRGLVGLLANSAGPPAVAPFGSTEPLTGTNPISFSFPLPGGDTQTFDFATSEVVWGAIRQAALEGSGLPSGPFMDASGETTTVPSDVNAVRAFGGSKGFALNLAIEILAGPLAGAKAGSRIESEFDCGAFMLAVDPSTSGASDSLGQEIATLLDEVRLSRAQTTQGEVRAPGDRGRSRIDIRACGDDELDIPPTTLDMLDRMSKGESIAELSSNPLFN